MHLFNWLNNKYGLDSMVQSWTKLITHSLDRFKAQDPEVYVFYLALNNHINEDFRFVLADMRTKMHESL